MANDIILDDRRRRGFFMVDDPVVLRYGGALKAHGLAAYMSLVCGANRATNECYARVEVLAARVGMSERQFKRELAKHEQLGLVAVTERYLALESGTLVSTTNIYHIQPVGQGAPCVRTASVSRDGGATWAPFTVPDAVVAGRRRGAALAGHQSAARRAGRQGQRGAASSVDTRSLPGDTRSLPGDTRSLPLGTGGPHGGDWQSLIKPDVRKPEAESKDADAALSPGPDDDGDEGSPPARQSPVVATSNAPLASAALRRDHNGAARPATVAPPLAAPVDRPLGPAAPLSAALCEVARTARPDLPLACIEADWKRFRAEYGGSLASCAAAWRRCIGRYNPQYETDPAARAALAAAGAPVRQPPQTPAEARAVRRSLEDSAPPAFA